MDRLRSLNYSNAPSDPKVLYAGAGFTALLTIILNYFFKGFRNFTALLIAILLIAFNFKAPSTYPLLGVNFIDYISIFNGIIILLIILFLLPFGEKEDEKANDDEKCMFKSTNYWAYILSTLLLVIIAVTFVKNDCEKVDHTFLGYKFSNSIFYFGYNFVFTFIQMVLLFLGRDWEFGFCL